MVEVGLAQESIPVVNDVTSVHDFSNQIPEIIPWHFTTTTSTFHVVLEYNRRVTEITLREGVFHVESLRTELSALAHNGMEVAEAEENSSDLGLTFIEILFLVHSNSTLHVSFESSWGLVSQLDGPFEEVNWDSSTGVRRQEESEGLVRAFNSERIEHFGDIIQESRDKMHVLEHNPLAFLVAHF